MNSNSAVSQWRVSCDKTHRSITIPSGKVLRERRAKAPAHLSSLAYRACACHYGTRRIDATTVQALQLSLVDVEHREDSI
jgi:hypothetical protein